MALGLGLALGDFGWHSIFRTRKSDRDVSAVEIDPPPPLTLEKGELLSCSVAGANNDHPCVRH